MNKEFIPYEQALALKELGFDKPCFGKWFEYDAKKHLVRESELRDAWWENNAFNLEVSAPLYQQVFRWFREKYNAAVVIEPQVVGYYAKIIINGKNVFNTIQTYEEAEFACLRKLIEIAKENK